MANVAHADLTGADLHEPKGADAAAVDKVYVSDGAGSGAWQKLTADQLTGTGNPFGSQLFGMADFQVAGTNGGTATSGAFRTRNLTEVANEITGASLTANQFTLPAGTFMIEGWACANEVNGHQTIIMNVTDDEPVAIGSSAYAAAGIVQNTLSHFSTRVDVVSPKVFELQTIVQTSKTDTGFGYPIGNDLGIELEYYSLIKIWKVA